MNKDVEYVLYNEEQLRQRVKELGEQITADYEGKEVLLVGVLKGAVVFMADLIRHINTAASLDFMSVSSYGAGTKSSGVVRILKDLDTDIAGKHILVIEDILDSGLTLSHLMKLLESRGAASIRLCTLFNKPERRKADIKPDYCGYDIPDAFIVGYGLDYDEKYRNLPYVGVLKPEVYGGQ